MAASTLAGIMAGIETQLKTIPGLRTASFMRNQINVPQAVVKVPPIPAYRESFGASGKWHVEVPVIVLVSQDLDKEGQQQLATFADITGANSIPNAIEADRTLGGAVDDAICWSFDEHIEDVGGVTYYGGQFLIHIQARRA